MKYIKSILLITAIVFATSVPFEVKSEDCSQYAKLHKKLLCKSRGGTFSKTAEIAETDNEGNPKKKSWFKKLREFGGKNIGEPG